MFHLTGTVLLHHEKFLRVKGRWDYLQFLMISWISSNYASVFSSNYASVLLWSNWKLALHLALEHKRTRTFPKTCRAAMTGTSTSRKMTRVKHQTRSPESSNLQTTIKKTHRFFFGLKHLVHSNIFITILRKKQLVQQSDGLYSINHTSQSTNLLHTICEPKNFHRA